MYKRTLEDVQEGRDDRVVNLYRTLDPIRTSFRKGQDFICGDTAAYADYVVFSQFQWARVTKPVSASGGGRPRLRLAGAYAGPVRRLRARHRLL